MGVQILMPNRQNNDRPEKEESALDKVLKGMQILQAGASTYGSISGGMAAGKNADTNAMQAQTQKSQADYEMGGGVYGKDALAHGDNFTYSDQESPNAIPLTIGDQKRFASPMVKKDKADNAFIIPPKDLLNYKRVPEGTKGSILVPTYDENGNQAKVSIIPNSEKPTRDPMQDFIDRKTVEDSFSKNRELRGVQVPGFEVVDGQVPTNQSATDLRKMQQSQRMVDSLIGDKESGGLMKDLNDVGTESKFTDRGAKMSSDYTQLVLELKELNRLGALAGPDKALLDSLAGESTDSWSPAAAGRIMAAMEKVKANAQNRLDIVSQSYGYKPTGQSAQSGGNDLSAQIAAEKQRRQMIRAQGQGSSATKPATFK